MADKRWNFIGKRISCEGYRGTVKYFGKVPPTSGEWLGVEWDDETRGKHDGTFEGVQYFSCSQPKSGSFVREKKINFGVSVVEALQTKYKGDVQKHIQNMHVVGKNTITEVELVGAEKVLNQQSCFEKIKEVSLRQNVNGPDKETSLSSISPNITELDLSSNLLSSWNDIAMIVHNLTKLKTLNVSDNRLTLPEDLHSLQASFNIVTELFLNKMNLSWKEVSKVIEMFPSLEKLHVCENGIKSLSGVLSCNKNIILLDLYGNQLTNWDEIQGLGALPRLSTLILSNNNIEQVSSEGEDKTSNFSSLKCLHLSQNQVKDISSINAFNMFGLLEELRFKDNPVFHGWTSFDSRQELISRVSSLLLVNGSLVTEKERRAAEQAYIKKYIQDWLSAGGSPDNSDSNKLDKQFTLKHPRYLELIKKHGLPDAGIVHKTSTTLKDSLISLTFKCPNDSSKKDITKKLPGTMTIGKVKGLLYRLYKVDSADQRLSYLDTKNDREIAMDDDLRQLSFYSVAQGDTIYIRW